MTSEIELHKKIDLFETFKNKCERIVSAIFLVSEHLSDNEMIKGKMRNISLDIVSQIIGFKDVGFLGYQRVQYIRKASLELDSLLNIALFSGLISEPNTAILKGELERFVAQIGELDNSRSLFGNQVASPEKDINLAINNIKDNSNQSVDSLSSVTPSSLYDKNNHKRKQIRNKSIIDIIRKKGVVSIKDISSSIKGCSEKTVQRELNLLITQGVVKKNGERRWSRYSLI